MTGHTPDDTGGRVLSAAELDDMRRAFRDPDYLARLAEDAKHAGMVEVDNPFRREVRPRRGTEKASMTDQADTPDPIGETWTDGDLVLVTWVDDGGGLSQWTGRIVGERMGKGGPKPHRIAGATVRVLESGAEVRALRAENADLRRQLLNEKQAFAPMHMRVERERLCAELAAARDREAEPCPLCTDKALDRKERAIIASRRVLCDYIGRLEASLAAALSQSGQPTKGEPA